MLGFDDGFDALRSCARLSLFPAGVSWEYKHLDPVRHLTQTMFSYTNPPSTPENLQL